ncbi:MAG: rod shape-determining protein MreD [Bacteroidetes bacterium]|nr:rod shape-determining protein MreD [Rhodothermia bacterium]MCS7155982.1 rod shape-determining protein MreD [Bacteroidota bacterium]MCX7907670.1 rod shape-determining protein MreD [Bacteroidota bacterium]MDW8137799.1 rod shape-determining protein MreD [Bacteroidota bacterium]MDW8286350.1 rod shape-determining protein MreD [Bacteroidota bacterium]
MIARWLRYIGGLLGIGLAQAILLERLILWGAVPDALLLLVAWVALRRGRLEGLLVGFMAGLLLDAIRDSWGLQMFTKTLTGYLIGLYPIEDRAGFVLRSQEAALVAFLSALLHNTFWVGLLALGQPVSLGRLVGSVWLGGALYTALIAWIGFLFWRPHRVA